MASPFTLTCEHRDDLTVLSFRGREAISRSFRFDVVVASAPADPAAIEAALLDRPALLAITNHDAPARRIAGVVSEVEWLGVQAHEHQAFRLRIVPRFERLARRTTSRIFQDLTVPEIVDRILDEQGVPRRWALSRKMPARGYCVQYRESDRAFVTRLLAEEGIFFFFEDPAEGADKDGEVVVFADDAAAYPVIPGGERLIFRRADGIGGLNPEENHVHRFTLKRAVRSSSTLLRDYDFRRPLLELASSEGSAAAPEGGRASRHAQGRVYEHRRDDEELDVQRETAAILLDQLRRKAALARGESACRRLAPGHRFTLDEHEIAALDRGWVITKIEHAGRSPEIAKTGEPIYENRFAAAPADVRFRPPPAARAPQQVTETALVVGPPGQEIHTDAHGRIKVQFHWDLDGQRSDASSCWIRVAQAWAGRNWGFQFIPRVGMEVLVTFLGGDVDRPVVTGCLYNANNPPSFPLPQSKASSGIRTQSTPGGGGHNELSFVDAKGAELVHLRAEKDLDVEVRGDRREAIGKDRSATVGGDDTLVVSGDRRREIRGDDHLLLEGGRKIEVTGDEQIFVAKDHEVQVLGLASTLAGGGMVVTSEGAYVLRVEGDYSVSVGSGGATGQIAVEGKCVISGSQSVQLHAQQRIALAVGPSSIEITEEGVTITAPSITLKGGEKVVVEGNGPRVSLGENAELVSEKIKVVAKGAKIELDDELNLKSGKIKMGKNEPAPAKEGDESEAKTKPFKVKLADADFEPYADKHYVAVAEGKRFEGSTDGDGGIDLEIPETAEMVEITAWIDEYPTGRQKRWTVKVAELPEASTPPGAILRLKNLGYLSGATPTEVDEGVKGALRWFQKDHELEETGEIDEATSAELAKVHGS